MIRRLTTTVAVATALLAAWVSAASAHVIAPCVSVPGTTPASGTAVYLPATGTCTTATGATSAVRTVLLGAGVLKYTGDGTLMLTYPLVIVCADGTQGIATIVQPGAGTYAFNDTTGTLTVRATVPVEIDAPTTDPDSGEYNGLSVHVSLASGAGVYPITYAASDSAEVKAVTSAHRTVDRVKTTTYDRALVLSLLVDNLGDC